MSGQLLYGSADQIAGRDSGGWGVLQSTGALTPEEGQALLDLVSVELPSTLPQFPSAEQLQRRAVRFRLDPIGDGYAVARSVEAGTDHTGRPGNVVTHGAVVAKEAGLRPADWFFSPGWLSPYGPRQIAEARLSDALAVPSGWAQTAAWLRAEPARTGRVRWIIDVALSLLMEHQQLLLVAPTAEEAARWVSMLSWLLDAATADQVRIRIGEDASSVAANLEKKPVIVTVTGADASLAKHRPVDVTWQLDANEAAETGLWRLPVGPRFPASKFTSLAVDLVYADQDVAAAVFAKRDEFIDRHVGSGRPLLVHDEVLYLQAAWLVTPHAQDLAREEPIREVLASLNGAVAAWDEFAGLAAELGVTVTTAATPEAPQDHDVYAMPDPSQVDPWQDLDDEPNPLVAALLGAATLAKEGVDVEALLAEGRIAERIDEHPEALRQAMRDIALALDPHANLSRGEG